MKPVDIVEILLVEDNPQDAELTVRGLRKRNLANQLFMVEDGAEALDYIFGQGKYAYRGHLNNLKVVLLDLKLPKIDGLQVLKAIKSDERTYMIPVVIMTSSNEDPDIKAAYELGANSYVVKPVDFDEFMVAMSQVGLYWLLVNQTSNRR